MHSTLAISALAHDPRWAAVYMLSHEAQLWLRLRDSADPTARNELLAMHAPYARDVADAYYARRMHDEIALADYLQLACLGLVEAVDRFDPDVGVIFKTFAARRMHGAIVDGVKRLTDLQQQLASLPGRPSH